MSKLTMLGHELESTSADDYSFHSWSEEGGVRVRCIVGRIDWPTGTPTPWYAAIETVPGVKNPTGREERATAWRFEGPFRETPEAAVRDFEVAWDACRKADRRCNPPATA